MTILERFAWGYGLLTLGVIIGWMLAVIFITGARRK